MSVVRCRSVDVFEQLDDLLYAGNALNQIGRLSGFLFGQQAQQVDDAVLGHDLDARTGNAGALD